MENIVTEDLNFNADKTKTHWKNTEIFSVIRIRKITNEIIIWHN